MKKGLRLAIILVALLTLVGCGTTHKTSPSSSKSAGKPVILKAVSAFPSNAVDNDGFNYFVNEVNTKGKGQISIKVLGGPEVVPSLQLAQALQTGTVDMANTPMGYETTLAPEALLFSLDMHTGAQKRADGFFDLFNQVMEQKANTVLLPALMEPGRHFNFYTTFPVKSVADFKGKPIRSSTMYNELLEALGASPVNLNIGDVYSALDRGVVEGYGWESIGVTQLGWDAKTKYIVQPDFYQSDVLIMVNRNKWNSLTDAQKKILTNAAIDAETAMKTKLQQVAAADRAKMLKEGITIENLPADQWSQYVKASMVARINAVKPKATPGWIAKYQKLVGQ